MKISSENYYLIACSIPINNYYLLRDLFHVVKSDHW